MFFSSNDTEQKRRLALLHAVLLIFKANCTTSPYVKNSQDNFIRTLANGLSRNPLFIHKAEDMSDLEMASILRNCSDFNKRSYAQTLSSAARETDNLQEASYVLTKIATECNIPLNYFSL